LALSPLLEDVAHYFELVIPNNDSVFERLFEWTELHRLCIDNVFIKDLLDIIVVFDQKGWLIRHKVEVYTLPNCLHFIQSHLNVVLFRCSLTDLNTDLIMLHQSHFKDVPKRKALVRLNFESHFGWNLIPMALLHAFLAQANHQRNFWPKLIKLCLNSNSYFQNGFDISLLKEPYHAR
jgi:hypothetical protein